MPDQKTINNHTAHKYDINMAVSAINPVGKSLKPAFSHPTVFQFLDEMRSALLALSELGFKVEKQKSLTRKQDTRALIQ